MLISSFLKASGRDGTAISDDNCNDKKTWLSFCTALFVGRFLGREEACLQCT